MRQRKLPSTLGITGNDLESLGITRKVSLGITRKLYELPGTSRKALLGIARKLLLGIIGQCRSRNYSLERSMSEDVGTTHSFIFTSSHLNLRVEGLKSPREVGKHLEIADERAPLS